MNDSEKKTTKKKVLKADEKTIEKVSGVLDQLLLEIAEKSVHPAEAIIRKNIEKIDALARKKMTLAQVYERLNRQIPLGISAASFTQYVRKIRQEIGSDLYVPRKSERKKEKETEAVQAVQEEWHCEKCEEKSQRHELSKFPGIFFWQCPECKANYTDINGVISKQRIK